MKSLNNILVIGDTCRDHIMSGDVGGMSQEAPIPLMKNPEYSVKGGMIENFVKNLENMTGEKLPESHIVANKDFSTDIWKYIDSRSGQQLLRIDFESKGKGIERKPLSVNDVNNKLNRDINTIVILDYDTGYISKEVIREISDWLKTYRRYKFYLDTRKKDLTLFDDWILKINNFEYNDALERYPDLGSRNQRTVVTMGKEGARVSDEGSLIYDIYRQYHKVPVMDATGCGETFFAAMILNDHLETYSTMALANAAASITASKLGTYAPTKREIDEVMKGS